MTMWQGREVLLVIEKHLMQVVKELAA